MDNMSVIFWHFGCNLESEKPLLYALYTFLNPESASLRGWSPASFWVSLTLWPVLIFVWQYVMRFREISLKSIMWHFQISIWLKCSFREVHFAEHPTWIGPVVQSYEQFKTPRNSRRQKKSITFSGCISQSMHLTSDWFR